MRAKFTWFVKNDDSQAAAFLRGRFLAASGAPKKTYVCSSIWVEIRKVWDFVEADERWVVGDGSDIFFWSDRWLSETNIREGISIPAGYCLEATVADFTCDGKWDLPHVESP
ncbi:uncharacterized protein LOC122059799 [Macadamia integrifolia]|uniref:uncharacterized protein LOC122059799 n=1 Tax=Macadamia integrifolia TaxID=60698 RepID=UPI001C52ABD8|nr:uncharacterized protein LOC122059799 [Macadamia integrifolia]